jgi:hypothetical protein
MALKRNDYILGAIVLYLAYVLFFKKEGYATTVYDCSQHTNTSSCGGITPKMNGCVINPAPSKNQYTGMTDPRTICKCADKTKCSDKLTSTGVKDLSKSKEELKQTMITIQNTFIKSLQDYLNDTKNDSHPESVKRKGIRISIQNIMQSREYQLPDSDPKKINLKKQIIDLNNQDVTLDNERVNIQQVIDFININGVKRDTDKIGSKLKLATNMLGPEYTKAFNEYTKLTNQQF